MNKGKHHAVMEGKGGGVMKGWVVLGLVWSVLEGFIEEEPRRGREGRGRGTGAANMCCL